MNEPRSERPRWEKALLALRYAVNPPPDMKDIAVSQIREHVAVLATERDHWKQLAEALVATEPQLTIVDGRFINYGDSYLITVVADPNATPVVTAAARAALVAAVRDADTLRQARFLAQVARAFLDDDAPDDDAPEIPAELLDLLDLLAPVADPSVDPAPPS